jgi:hypothetical protein
MRCRLIKGKSFHFIYYHILPKKVPKNLLMKIKNSPFKFKQSTKCVYRIFYFEFRTFIVEEEYNKSNNFSGCFPIEKEWISYIRSNYKKYDWGKTDPI